MPKEIFKNMFGKVEERSRLEGKCLKIFQWDKKFKMVFEMIMVLSSHQTRNLRVNEV